MVIGNDEFLGKGHGFSSGSSGSGSRAATRAHLRFIACYPMVAGFPKHHTIIVDNFSPTQKEAGPSGPARWFIWCQLGRNASAVGAMLDQLIDHTRVRQGTGVTQAIGLVGRDLAQDTPHDLA